MDFSRSLLAAGGQLRLFRYEKGRKENEHCRMVKHFGNSCDLGLELFSLTSDGYNGGWSCLCGRSRSGHAGNHRQLTKEGINRA